MSELEAVLRHLDTHFDDHLEDLQAFVQIPSVGAQPDHDEDVKAAAAWLAKRMEAAGIENVDIVETDGHPVVLGDWLHAPGAPTLLVYGHYDVQPADLDDGWVRPPFAAEIAEGRIWGRGTTDDKGQMFCHVLAAEAWLKAHGKMPLNVKFVFEGEEETGSTNFPMLIEKMADRLKADVLVVSDSPMRSEGHPAITYSLRGLCSLEVDVEGPSDDLHSGSFGGALWNPIEALSHMLASCKDSHTGKILVPGFYDNVVEPDADERATLARDGESPEEIMAAAGVDALWGEEGWAPAERTGLRPTFELNGIWGGYTGEGGKTIIPRSAHAKISCRLVAGQDPEDVVAKVEAHLRAVAKPGTRLTVRTFGEGRAVRSPPDHPLVRAVGRAYEAAFGNPAVSIPEGGSIPAVAFMQHRLGALPVMAGFGHRDERMHGIGESFRLSSFQKGREASARMMQELTQ